MGELLFLSLSREGLSNAHAVINTDIVLEASRSGSDLVTVATNLANGNDMLRKALDKVPQETLDLIRHPENYTGEAIEIAVQQSGRMLVLN